MPAFPINIISLLYGFIYVSFLHGFQSPNALSVHNPSLAHALKFCQERMTAQAQLIAAFKDRFGRAAGRLDKLKHWGIEIHDEITESEFFNEVFMVRVVRPKRALAHLWKR